MSSLSITSLRTEWCRNLAWHDTAHKMTLSLSITSHCTQNDVVRIQYITLNTDWCRQWILYHTANRMASSLSITSQRTQYVVTEHYVTAHKMMSSFSISHIAHWMKLSLALLISHARKIISSLIITSDMHTEWCHSWISHPIRTENDVVIDHYITMHTE